MESPIAYLSAGADAFLVNPSKELFVAQVTSILRNRSFIREAAAPGQSGPLSASRDAAFVSRLGNFILDNIQNPDLSVARLSSAMHMSPSNLFKRVRETFGISPNALVNEIRLSKAKEILDKSETDISEIVFLTGFNSHSYFSKCFKRRFGMSPSEYLLENRGKLTPK
ncbi:MAG: helix-turn-helix transcriptional regulator [Candidatus Cryptobacteroides sp.]